MVVGDLVSTISASCLKNGKRKQEIRFLVVSQIPWRTYFDCCTAPCGYWSIHLVELRPRSSAGSLNQMNHSTSSDWSLRFPNWILAVPKVRCCSTASYHWRCRYSSCYCSSWNCCHYDPSCHHFGYDRIHLSRNNSRLNMRKTNCIKIK